MALGEIMTVLIIASAKSKEGEKNDFAAHIERIIQCARGAVRVVEEISLERPLNNGRFLILHCNFAV